MSKPFAFLVLALAGCSNTADVAPPPAVEPGAQAPAEQPTEPAPAAAGTLPEASSARPDDINRWVLLGIDGIDPRVVDDMWSQGRMRNLRRLCDEGVCTKSSSAWASSPVIWTTVATGVVPEKHGIDRFVNETMEGRIPISANDRKVAAIWDVSSDAGLKTAQLGWWATWPAYDINGVNISARANKGASMADRVKPASLEALFDAELEQAVANQDTFSRCENMAANDAWVSYWTPKLAADDYDLIVAYLRCIDVVSHRYWGYWDIASFPKLDPVDVAANKDVLPDNYEAADQALGALVAALPPDTNVIVLSDHGFLPTKQVQSKVRVYTDKLLAHMGYAALDEAGQAIPGESRVVLWNTAPAWFRQKVRFMVAGRDEGGTVPQGEVEALKQELKDALKPITYSSGKFAFRLIEPNAEEAKVGADAVIQVLKAGPTRVLDIQGREIDDVIGPITMNTGNHHPVAPNGFFLAWGPDIDKGFAAEAFRVQDVAPTVAYGLGLPIAQDFDGEVVETLLSTEFRNAHNQQLVATWGKRSSGPSTASEADNSMVEELQALGYIE